MVSHKEGAIVALVAIVGICQMVNEELFQAVKYPSWHWLSVSLEHPLLCFGEPRLVLSDCQACIRVNRRHTSFTMGAVLTNKAGAEGAVAGIFAIFNFHI